MCLEITTLFLLVKFELPFIFIKLLSIFRKKQTLILWVFKFTFVPLKKKKKVNIFTSFQAGEGSINTLFLQGDPSVHVQMDENV